MTPFERITKNRMKIDINSLHFMMTQDQMNDLEQGTLIFVGQLVNQNFATRLGNCLGMLFKPNEYFWSLYKTYSSGNGKEEQEDYTQEDYNALAAHMLMELDNHILNNPEPSEKGKRKMCFYCRKAIKNCICEFPDTETLSSGNGKEKKE